MVGSLAIRGHYLGLPQAEEHRLVHVRSRDHRAVRGRQGRRVPAQARQRSGLRGTWPDSALHRHDVSYNHEHHDEQRHFYVRDMVEKFELEVPYVPTDENPADFLTKPMPNSKRFNELRRIIMNEPYYVA